MAQNKVQYQEAQGLAVDGVAGPNTRRALYLAYMDRLCGDLRLDRGSDFLAGSDAGSKGDAQGCSEFNPVRLCSQDEEQAFGRPANRADRNRENEPNRRVMLLLFGPGTRIDPGRWPCPRACEGTAGCKARFWSDGEARRNTPLAGERREFARKQDTFACRFYQRLVDKSPCERLLRDVAIYRVVDEVDGLPVANALFEIRFPGGRLRRLRSDDDGVIRMVGVEGQVFTMVGIDDENRPGSIRDKASAADGGGDA